MPEKIDIGDGEWVVIRDLTGQDRKDFLIRAEKRRKSKGPAVLTEVDPEDPAATRQVPNPDAEFGIFDNYQVIDETAADVIESWSLQGDMPFTPEHRRFIPLRCDEAFTAAIVQVMDELSSGTPKEKPGEGSSTTSPGEPETLPMESAAES